MTPHDALFKATFSEPAAAAGLCRTVLPAAVLERRGFEVVRLQPTAAGYITAEAVREAVREGALAVAVMAACWFMLDTGRRQAGPGPLVEEPALEAPRAPSE